MTQHQKPQTDGGPVAAAYLHRSLEQLSRFARRQGFMFVAHLIEVAGEAAIQEAGQPNPTQNERPPVGPLPRKIVS